MVEASWISRMADASTMFLTRNRFTALSLGHSTPEASQRTRRTCPRAPAGLFRPLALLFFVMFATPTERIEPVGARQSYRKCLLISCLTIRSLQGAQVVSTAALPPTCRCDHLRHSFVSLHTILTRCKHSAQSQMSLESHTLYSMRALTPLRFWV